MLRIREHGDCHKSHGPMKQVFVRRFFEECVFLGWFKVKSHNILRISAGFFWILTWKPMEDQIQQMIFQFSLFRFSIYSGDRNPGQFQLKQKGTTKRIWWRNWSSHQKTSCLNKWATARRFFNKTHLSVLADFGWFGFDSTNQSVDASQKRLLGEHERNHFCNQPKAHQMIPKAWNNLDMWNTHGHCSRFLTWMILFFWSTG